jgi:hypothetical protein
VRIALLLLAVLAVVLPTALVPQLAYSNQQVLSAFKAQGLRLHLTGETKGRDPGSARVSDSESFFRSDDREFSVVVFSPTRLGMRFEPTGGVPPQAVWVRNVVVVWTSTVIVPSELTKIHAALTGLAAFPTR